MIKTIFMLVMAVFFTVSLLVIWYWRDAGYEPSRLDLISYFILLPLGLSLLLLSPYLLRKWYKQRKENKAALREQKQTDISPNESVEHQTEWLHLQVFSAASKSALGENEQLLAALIKLQGPELDTALVDGVGNPILSYRIPDLDGQSEVESFEEHALQQRIYLLLQQQLEQHSEILYSVAQQLKKSAYFYNSPLAYQYRVHPAWVNPQAADDLIEETPAVVEPVFRLDALNIHILLSEDLLHRLAEETCTAAILPFLNTLGILPAQTQFHYHYFSQQKFSQQKSETDWIELLKLISQQQHEVSLVLLADSEIDQDCIDEKIWITPAYTPAEFASSCCIASLDVDIEKLEKIKSIHAVLHEEQLITSLGILKIIELEQYALDQPFVLILDDPADIKTAKNLTQHFAQTPIEPHHYIYSAPSLGHTQNLSKCFGFMLALQIKDPNYGMIFSVEQPKTQVFIAPEHIKIDQNDAFNR